MTFRWMKQVTLASTMLFAPIAFSVTEGELFPKVDLAKSQKESPKHELANKVTIINFWATWCEACKIELKEMQTDFAALLGEKDFQFMFVSLDKDPSKAEAWVKDNIKEADKFLSFLYLDPEFKAAESLSVDSFPMTFVIGKDGKIAKIQRGFKEGEGSTKAIAELANKLIKG